MRKHKKPLVRAKSARRKWKSRLKPRATIPATSLLAAGILGVGLTAVIFGANYKNEKNHDVSAYIDPPTISKSEVTAAPRIDSLPSDRDFITGSIPPHQTLPVPLPAPRPKIVARKKHVKEERSFFSFFTLPQNSTAQKR
jgi:hypothetical protein